MGTEEVADTRTLERARELAIRMSHMRPGDRLGFMAIWEDLSDLIGRNEVPSEPPSDEIELTEAERSIRRFSDRLEDDEVASIIDDFLSTCRSVYSPPKLSSTVALVHQTRIEPRPTAEKLLESPDWYDMGTLREILLEGAKGYGQGLRLCRGLCILPPSDDSAVYDRVSPSLNRELRALMCWCGFRNIQISTEDLPDGRRLSSLMASLGISDGVSEDFGDWIILLRKLGAMIDATARTEGLSDHLKDLGSFLRDKDRCFADATISALSQIAEQVRGDTANTIVSFVISMSPNDFELESLRIRLGKGSHHILDQRVDRIPNGLYPLFLRATGSEKDWAFAAVRFGERLSGTLGMTDSERSDYLDRIRRLAMSSPEYLAYVSVEINVRDRHDGEDVLS